MSTADTNEARATVYFDGACPLCRREIGFYRRRRGADRLTWTDVSAPGADVGPGLTREAALGRFHVRLPSGALTSGGDAFIEIWRRLDGWRWLATLAAMPGARWMTNRAYDFFLRFRPRIQRLFRTA